VSQSVRAIFAELHVAWIAGRGPFLASERPAGIAWGCLQAFKRMKDFTKHKFSADLKISHILNLHLQDNAVMRSELVGLRAQMMEAMNAAAEAVKEAKAARKACDSLTSRANNKQKKKDVD
jgi:hypothetical protein